MSAAAAARSPLRAGEPWASAAGILRSSGAYRSLLDPLQKGRRAAAARLPVPAAAWVTELLAADLARQVLVLVPHESDVVAWVEAAALFGRDAESVLAFPAPSLTPYHEAEPALPVLVQEIVALDRLLSGAARTVVATPRALFRRLPLRAELEKATIVLRPGDETDLGALAQRLARFGYRREDLVLDVGSFAVRGGVFDVFPPGAELPLRLDFFGDTVESIRSFEAQSQRSLAGASEARLLPLHLFPAGPDDARALAAALRRQGAADRERLAALSRGEGFPGWQNYLPLVASATTHLDSVCAGGLRVAVDAEGLAAAAAQHGEQLRAEVEHRREHGRLWVDPEALELPLADVGAAVAAADLTVGGLDASGAADFRASVTDVLHGQLPRFPREVETARSRGERLVLVAPAENLPRLRAFLDRDEVTASGVELVAGELGRGFRLPPAGIVVFGEGQVFPPAAVLPRRVAGRPRLRAFVGGLRDLRIGDFVVHADHGIGRFAALRAVAGGDGAAAAGLPPALRPLAPASAGESEVMEIEYAGGKRLLLPLARLDLLERYSGLEGVAPRLDQLGGTSWNKAKERVKKGMRDMAQELLRLYAERQMAKAPALPPDDDWMRQFEAAFAYEETADQLEAIATIKEDLERERPMDRLLCGDVGYGKTEVAMRAAFKAVAAGFQVAVLCPTTILADQHWETFRRRFAGFPVEVEMVSRFRTPAELKGVRARLAAGKIDILIGTHRLLGRDVTLPRLGLVVIDEEQRFGVAQKERLKRLKKEVHVLAMSATPVPRTLQFSLAGVRDLSVIETPPKDRMAVETAVLPFGEDVVREAIEFELGRGGQVYYVHNRVESIEKLSEWLRALVPNLRITVGHGQLEERELARRMHAFTAGEFDLLLATTIIENGIDIPNVNTMIVHRADRFGLAQLYQLRGRVGRSSQLAYCYLMVAGDRVLSEPARRRLEALREFSDLGAGFRIAARDLEIRGAGNLLGGEQSGHIATVGIETYLKLLDESIRELRGEVVEDAPSTAVDLGVVMAIPVDYVRDANVRMECYQRVAASSAPREELLAELRDRFGPPPPEVRTLLEVAEVKRMAEALRVQSVALAGKRLTLRLRRDARIEVERLIELVSATPGATFSPTGVLSLEVLGGGIAALALAREVLATLAVPAAAEVSP